MNPRRVVTRLPAELVQPEPFDPGETATFLARQRDVAGETAWRDLMIENYRELGAELVRIREKANLNETALGTRVTAQQLLDFKKEFTDEINRTLNRQWAFIVAVAAVYGAVLAFIAEKVFK
jgi:hypothetical protein